MSAMLGLFFIFDMLEPLLINCIGPITHARLHRLGRVTKADHEPIRSDTVLEPSARAGLNETCSSVHGMEGVGEAVDAGTVAAQAVATTSCKSTANRTLTITLLLA